MLINYTLVDFTVRLLGGWYVVRHITLTLISSLDQLKNNFTFFNRCTHSLIVKKGLC